MVQTYLIDNSDTVLNIKSPDTTEWALTISDTGVLESGGGSAAPVDSVFGRTGAVVAVAGDYDETLGGTGQTTYVTGDILYASASNTLSKLAVGSDTNVLTLSGGVPTWAAAPAGAVSSVFGRTGVVVAATNDYTWAQVDKTVSSLNDVTTKRIGDTTNHTDWASDGTQTMGGTARVKKTLNFYAYNIGGLAGTYNSISNGASGLSSLNGFYFKSFDDGGGAGTAEASNISFELPNDYVDGTDLEVEFGMIVGSTSTNDVRWQCGATFVSETDTYSPSTYTWATPQNVAGPGTTWERKLVKFTLSGTGMTKEDDVTIVIFRDADNAADNLSGDAYFPVVEVYYISDRLGGATV